MGHSSARKKRYDITQQDVLDKFTYGGGVLTWKTSGKVAGYQSKVGYVQVGVNRRLYYLHQLIFLYHHGYIPDYVDHINRNKTDSRIENLRAVSSSENGINKSMQSNNISGYTGVSYNTKTGKWVGRITINGAYKFLGYFTSPEEANESVSKEKSIRYEI